MYYGDSNGAGTKVRVKRWFLLGYADRQGEGSCQRYPATVVSVKRDRDTITVTASYSPSQNGVAERANQTLVELAHAMINAQHVPEFLWEHAIEHASYIRNRSYTCTLKGEMPYEIWHGLKPSVAHLREFSTPVWVLLQGQAQQCKILPKSKQRLYVGHEDGPQAIKYYNADVRKVLTSHNY